MVAMSFADILFDLVDTGFDVDDGFWCGEVW
jgi:hypothetical protein